MNPMALMPLMSVSVVFIAAAAFADVANLGASLPLKTHSNGTPAFSATYAYGDDPHGSNYLLTLSARSTSLQQYRWNFYLASSDAYVMDWSSNRTTYLAAMQVKLSDVDVVTKLLAGQKKPNGKPELYFVLADDNNLPVYNVSISDICASSPKSFKNLTDDKGCDQF